MNIYFIISLVFLGISIVACIELLRLHRKSKQAMSRVIDHLEAGMAFSSGLDAEQERESSTGGTFSQDIERTGDFGGVAPTLEAIGRVERNFIPELAPTMIICQPTLEAMSGAALLKRCYDWAEISVTHSGSLVKTLYVVNRLSPRPEYVFIVGNPAGYVQGRRLIQALSRLKENGVRVVWYDNHAWLPLIARNISRHCFDFVLCSQQVSISELIFHRFNNMLDDQATLIRDLARINIHTAACNRSVMTRWWKLLALSIEEDTSFKQSRMVARLAKLAPIRFFDRWALNHYSKKIVLTQRLVHEQQHLVELAPELNLSIIDLRPIHREKSIEGTILYVFRGQKPVTFLPELVFHEHQTQLVFIIHSLQQYELRRAANVSVNLTRLIDITLIENTPVRIDGSEEHVFISLDLPFSKRFFSAISLIWPPEIPSLIDTINRRLQSYSI